MLRVKCLLIVLFAASFVNCESETETNFSVELTPDNFKDAVAKKNHFVMFYAPWCGHCKKVFPIWEKLAETLNVRDQPYVVIAKVDCKEHQKLCAEHDITGYPTMKLYKPNNSEPTNFKGTRDVPTITNFINELLGNDRPADEEESHMPEIVQTLVELTDKTFAKYTSVGKHFIKFYAPWCGHCQRLAPTWEELANSLQHDNAVRISKIDCTVYRPICQDFEVKGYPTLLWIEDGKKVEKYTGARGHEDLKSYVDKMAGESQPKGDAPDPDSEGDSSSVVLLSGDNFNHAVEKGTTFVKFYAPWCGHCQKMAPIWDQLAVKFIGNSNVKIAKVDCTLADNKELCNEQLVEGYPTLFIYVKGKKVTEYNGSRHLDDLHEFVARHAAEHDEL